MRPALASVTALVLGALLGALLVAPATALADPPANDQPANATPIPSLPAVVPGNTSQATLDDDEPSPLVATDDNGRQHGLDKSVWYAYTPEKDRALLADTCDANFTSHIDVYSADATGLTQVATKSNAYRDCPGDRRSFSVRGGVKYLIRVTAERDGVRVPDGGVFHLQVIPQEPPANDRFADATTLPGTGEFTAGLAFPTLELGEPSFEDETGSVWYRLAPTVSQAYTASVAASPYQITLAAFEARGSTINTLRRLGDDYTESSVAAQVSFNALKGHVYYLRLGTGASVAGDAKLSLTTNTAAGLGLIVTPATNTLKSVRATGLHAILSCARSCRLGVDLLVSPSDAKRYHLVKGTRKPRKPVRVGHVGGTLSTGVPTDVVVPISSKKNRERLNGASAVHFILRVSIRARGSGKPVTRVIVVR